MNTSENVAQNTEQTNTPNYPECFDLLTPEEQNDIDTSIYLLRSGNANLAGQQILALLAKYPTSPYLHASAYILLANVGKTHKAELIAEKNYSLYQDNPMFLCGYGRVLLGQRRLDVLAEQLVKIAHYLQEKSKEGVELPMQEKIEFLVVLSEYHFLRIAALLESNPIEIAFDAWRKALETLPGHPALTGFAPRFAPFLKRMNSQAVEKHNHEESVV